MIEQRIDELIKLIDKAIYEYYILDKPTITDQEYDRYMQNRLTQAEKDYLEIMNIEIKELDKNN